MKIIPQAPLSIKSSNVSLVESGINVYSSLNTYQSGDEVQHGEYVWECLKNNLSNVTPQKGTNWKIIRKTNYHNLFDPKRNYRTVNANEIVYTFNVTHVDTIALFGLEAKTVTVTIKDSLGVEQDKRVIETYKRDVYDWKDWRYSLPEFIDSVYINDLEMFYEGEMEVRVENQGNTAQVAHLVYGRALNLGMTIANDPKPVTSIYKDIVKESNGSETAAIYERMLVSVIVDSDNSDSIYNRLRRYIKDYCLFVGDDRDGGHASLVKYGQYKSIDVPIGIFTSIYEIEIEGVTYE